MRGLPFVFPAVAVAGVIGLGATTKHFQKARAKKIPGIAAIASRADNLMSVVYHCRFGDSFERIKTNFKGSCAIAIHKVGPDRLRVSVTWPNVGHRFVGRFNSNRLIWCEEQIQLPAEEAPTATRMCLINETNPIAPMTLTTLETGNRFRPNGEGQELTDPQVPNKDGEDDLG